MLTNWQPALSRIKSVAQQPDYSKEDKQYVKWGVPPPERSSHGTPDEIRASLVKAVCTNWRLEGNKLTADTNLGTLVQFIPTDMVCDGTDSQGLPILRKLVL